jgi:hypothetical protein
MEVQAVVEAAEELRVVEDALVELERSVERFRRKCKCIRMWENHRQIRYWHLPEGMDLLDLLDL